METVSSDALGWGRVNRSRTHPRLHPKTIPNEGDVSLSSPPKKGKFFTRLISWCARTCQGGRRAGRDMKLYIPLGIEVELQVEAFSFLDLGSFAKQGGNARGMETTDIISTTCVIVGLETECR